MISTILKSFLKPLAIAGSLLLALNTSSAFAVSVGDTAPNFKLPRLEAKGNIQLKSYLGKVVYVDFWASWCGPCRLSLPVLNTLRKKYRKQGFEVIAINLDEEKSEAMAFLKEFPVAYPTARDVTGTTPDQYGLQGMPTAYLIDRKGKVSLIHEGFKKTDSRELSANIATLLKKKR
ncbi:MAG: TlpA disulfide reductase family protein [Oleispira sp.]